MPLNTLKLETDILAILDDMATREADPTQARRDFARQLATAITSHIRTGTVTTTGTAAPQTGIIQ